MAGHSHAANIKHKKAAADAKRGAAFSKHAKLITTAARMGGGDPSMNARLTLAIEKARADNMPKDKIERAIKKGTGELGGAAIVDIRYEAYGPGGAAMLIDCMTDNRNRTAPEIRQLLERNGGRLAEAGAVAWMFDARSVVGVAADNVDEDRLTECVMDLGGQDLRREGDEFEVIADPTLLQKLHEGLAKAGFQVKRSELAMLPKTTVNLGKADAERMFGLLDELEEHDDVQNSFSNLEVSDAILAELERG